MASHLVWPSQVWVGVGNTLLVSSQGLLPPIFSVEILGTTGKYIFFSDWKCVKCFLRQNFTHSGCEVWIFLCKTTTLDNISSTTTLDNDNYCVHCRPLEHIFLWTHPKILFFLYPIALIQFRMSKCKGIWLCEVIAQWLEHLLSMWRIPALAPGFSR